MTHQEYFLSIVLRDIVQRHDVRHPQAVVDLAHRLISQIGSLYSYNALLGFLKSLGHKITKAFVAECIQWFEDAYFLFSANLYDRSVARQKVNPRKIYCVDHALVRSMATGGVDDWGHLLENLVFMHLRRKTEKIYYCRTRTGREVDFLWFDSTNKKHLWQVCATMENNTTRDCEIAALRAAIHEHKLHEGTIVTHNEREDIECPEGRIAIVPFYDLNSQ